MTLLTVENLHVSYPAGGGSEVHAVRGVSLELEQGETLAIVGESGCGKSSVANALTRLIAPSAGRIVFGELDMSSLRGRALRGARRGMQAIFQNPLDALDPRMRIGRSIEEPMWLQGVEPAARRERVSELVAAVELDEEHLGRYPHQLSGGQQQRAVIARALTMRPRLLVLDEPTSSLDFVVRDSIIDLLIRIQRETGCAYIFISHDLGTVRQIAHRLAVMYLGNFVEVGSSAQILSDPAHPYTRALLDAVPVPDPALRHQRPILAGEALDEVAEGCPFRARCPLAYDACIEAPALLPIGGRVVACHRSHHDDAAASTAEASLQ